MDAEPAKKWNAWSDADDARLRELIAENLSYAAIGALIGRNRNACIGRAHRLGIQVKGTRPITAKLVKQDVQRAIVKLFPPKPRPAPKAKAPAPAPAPAPLSLTALAQDNKPVPLYAPPEASTTAFGVPRPLLKLQAHHCKFPVDERDGQHWFCCADRDGMLPYCRDHAALCFRKTERQLTTKAYR
jgi:GcrA cell cycle regulator